MNLPAMTITEALQEIKTINARIAKKREAVTRYFVRDGRIRDPLEKEGGSAEFVRKERQAIRDLEERIVTIRSAIQASNLQTRLAINGTERFVQEWLNWRREVAQGQKQFIGQLIGGIGNVRKEAQSKGRNITEDANAEPNEIIVFVNEKALAEEAEQMEETLGTLDGKLSLLNATTTLKV